MRRRRSLDPVASENARHGFITEGEHECSLGPWPPTAARDAPPGYWQALPASAASLSQMEFCRPREIPPITLKEIIVGGYHRQ